MLCPIPEFSFTFDQLAGIGTDAGAAWLCKHAMNPTPTRLTAQKPSLNGAVVGLVDLTLPARAHGQSGRRAARRPSTGPYYLSNTGMSHGIALLKAARDQYTTLFKCGVPFS